MHAGRRTDWIPTPDLRSASWRFDLIRAAIFTSIPPIRPFIRASIRIISRTSAMPPRFWRDSGRFAGWYKCLAEGTGRAGNPSRPGGADRTANSRLYSPDHPNDVARVGSCKMGNDELAVVDSDLRVRGMRGCGNRFIGFPDSAISTPMRRRSRSGKRAPISS